MTIKPEIVHTQSQQSLSKTRRKIIGRKTKEKMDTQSQYVRCARIYEKEDDKLFISRKNKIGDTRTL